MSRFALHCLAVLLLPAALPAQPEPHPIDRAMEAAIEKDPSTAGQNRAISEALKKWDAELNKHYQTLIKSLDDAAATKLRESQRAWVVWRDKEIASLDAFFSKMQGTMWLPVHSSAVMKLTRQRALELGRLAEFLLDRE